MGFAGLLLGALLLFFMLPLGASEPTTGRIEHFGMTEGRYGSRLVAVIHIQGETRQVSLPRSTLCEVGDQIHLQRQRHLWRNGYTVADANPCARN